MNNKIKLFKNNAIMLKLNNLNFVLLLTESIALYSNMDLKLFNFNNSTHMISLFLNNFCLAKTSLSLL